MTPNKFDYEETIIIVNTNGGNHHLQNALGSVNGMTLADDGRWYYSVFVDVDNCSWCFYEEDIRKDEGSNSKNQ